MTHLVQVNALESQALETAAQSTDKPRLEQERVARRRKGQPLGSDDDLLTFLGGESLDTGLDNPLADAKEGRFGVSCLELRLPSAFHVARTSRHSRRPAYDARTSVEGLQDTVEERRTSAVSKKPPWQSIAVLKACLILSRSAAHQVTRRSALNEQARQRSRRTFRLVVP